MGKGKKLIEKRLGSRLVLEGLVIVVSILLAFALDAAWEDRQQRLIKEEYLRVLEDEFISAADEMQEQIGYHERQLAAIETMIEDLTQGRDFSISDFRRLGGLYYFGPAHPVFTDLANMSSVNILGFTSLRMALFSYGRQKEFLQNLHQRETAFWQNEMEPYLTRRFDYSFVLDGYPDDGKVSRIMTDEPGSHDDQYLKNLLIKRRNKVRGQLAKDRDIAQSIEDILTSIRLSKPSSRFVSRQQILSLAESKN